MFGMGLSEIFMIAVVAILFLGPDKLPDTMVQIAKFFRSFKRTIDDAKSSLDEELRIKELKEEAFKYKQQLDKASRQVEQTVRTPLATLEDLDSVIEKEKEHKATSSTSPMPEIEEETESKRTKVTFPKKSKHFPEETVATKVENEMKKESHV